MPGLTDVLGNVTNNANSAIGIAGRGINIFSQLDDSYYSSDHIRDINTNGFLSEKTVFNTKFFARAFDEPTYLTFRVEFCFDDEHRNMSYDDSENTTTVSDSKKIGFYGTMYDYMPEPFLQTYKAGETNEELGSMYCTSRYLNYSLGEHGRAMLLENVRTALKDIQDNFPYYFTSIEGLSSLNKVEPQNGIRVKDGLITLKCYEGLDLKITQIKQMIRKIMWDDMYQRWVLPDMMRYFSMKIYISEIRTFHEFRSMLYKNRPRVYDFSDEKVRNSKTLPTKSTFGQIVEMTDQILDGATAVANNYFAGTGFASVMNGANDIVSSAEDIAAQAFKEFTYMCMSALNEMMPTICLDCHMCEFDISDTFSVMSNLNSSAKGGNPQEQEIKIKVGQVQDYQVYPLNINLKPKESGKAYDFSFENAVHEGTVTRNDTGNVIFADTAFDKQLRSVGNEQNKILQNRLNEYKLNLMSEFQNLGFMVNGKNGPSSFMRKGIYGSPIDSSMSHINNTGEMNGYNFSGVNNNFRYKKNSTDLYTSISTMISTGINFWSLGSNESRSKATSLTQEELESIWPEVYAATAALKNAYEMIEDSRATSNKVLSEEMHNSIYINLLNGLSMSEATNNTALGAIARGLLGNLKQQIDDAPRSMATSGL